MTFYCQQCNKQIRLKEFLEWELELKGSILKQCICCNCVTNFAPRDYIVPSYKVKTYEEFLVVNGLKKEP